MTEPSTPADGTSPERLKIVFGFLSVIDYAAEGPKPTDDANCSRVGPVNTHPGGIGNGAPVAAKLLGPGKVGCATMLAPDANGEAFNQFMQFSDVDTGGIIWTNQLDPEEMFDLSDGRGGMIPVPAKALSTGMSFVCIDPTDKTGSPDIYFSPGANDAFGREHVNMKYTTNSDALVISYAGILPRLDGEPMAQLIRDVRAAGTLTILDTHSIPGLDYSALDAPLPEVDVFACNIHEARQITGMDEEAPIEHVMQAVTAKMGIDGSRTRLCAITQKDELQCLHTIRQARPTR